MEKLKKEWELLKNKLSLIRSQNSNLEVSPYLVIMLIAAEDHRYGKHLGVDFVSVVRALWRLLLYKKKEGASTIAMQLVRVTTGRYERTIRRKIDEMFLALLLSYNFNRFEIPRLYLAVAYYGWQMNGLKQASKRLNLNLSNISRVDAAAIVARLKYPEPKQLTKERACQIEARIRYVLNRADKLYNI